MSRQVPSSSIAVSFSTRRALLPGWMAQQVAAQAGIRSLDVDAASAPGGWLAARLEAPDVTDVSVSTLWLPAGELHSQRSRRLIERIRAAPARRASTRRRDASRQCHSS